MNLTEEKKEQCRELDEALNYGCQLYLDADAGLIYANIGPSNNSKKKRVFKVSTNSAADRHKKEEESGNPD